MTELVPIDGGGLDRAREPDTIAAAWLLSYKGKTRAAYAADLREWAAWLQRLSLTPFVVERVHVDAFVRHLEELGRAPSTIARKLAALAGFYDYAVEEAFAMDRNPVARVRRPKLDDASQTLGLDREQLVRFLAAAEAEGPRANALCHLLALNGLRVSEPIDADIDDLGQERGHTVLEVTRKGNRKVRVPLAPLTVGFLHDYLDVRVAAPLPGPNPLFTTDTGRRWDRHGAFRVVTRLARTAGITGAITPHSLRHAFVTLALDAGASLRDVQDAAGHADPRTTRRYDRARGAHDRNPTFLLAGKVAQARREWRDDPERT